ncbi:ATP-dependent DNA helicase RecQ [Deinococcus maricopensis DSM 21211]|uniref:DNA helicase RecQ n=1 Tax=Deinococcus maricopensis (strain DSM 21211 / LMG 22137 / NRRL B-23946 / LB-34) TaxID=709986 RepID=E8U9W9_DEIML|nr:ATP-dependent DNA helicase RecQ [Deinococcus maricopensis DSM 21211]
MTQAPPSAAHPDALHALQTIFGYPAFRGPQADIVNTVIAGEDALVLMPTGGGKSLCYQIPSLVRPGVGIVISPLIALMKDQVDALRVAGVRAAALNSTLSAQGAREIEDALLRGDLDLLYVAPERLLLDRTLNLLDRADLALFAIDEAHCVSQWGHDFRPEYTGLGVLAERYPHVPRMALTATADDRTRDDIVRVLDLHGARTFISSFDRPNIQYRVTAKSSARTQLLDFIRTEHPGDAGIVYCLSRKSVEETAAWLCEQGLTALPYHAGLDARTRDLHQERFLREEGLIVVATVAFGMGIDKPNVRFVAHLDLPKSLEGYYQETGRAGRDGLPSTAWMAYGLADVVNVRRMLAQSTAPDDVKRVEGRKLDALLAYAESAACRRVGLLAYFGEDRAESCGNCDTCLNPPRTWDATRPAQMALSAAVRTGNRFGAQHLTDVLLGRDTPRIRALGHHQLPTYGVGKDHDEKTWRAVLRQLTALGYLTTDADGHGSLIATPQARTLLKGEVTLTLRDDPAPKKGAKAPRGAAQATLAPEDQALFDALRTTRLDLAREGGVPPYVIFHDATLKAMAEARPQTLAALGAISGVGERKLQQYGDRFLTVLQDAGAGTTPARPPPRPPRCSRRPPPSPPRPSRPWTATCSPNSSSCAPPSPARKAARRSRSFRTPPSTRSPRADLRRSTPSPPSAASVKRASPSTASGS